MKYCKMTSNVLTVNYIPVCISLSWYCAIIFFVIFIWIFVGNSNPQNNVYGLYWENWNVTPELWMLKAIFIYINQSFSVSHWITVFISLISFFSKDIIRKDKSVWINDLPTKPLAQMCSGYSDDNRYLEFKQCYHFLWT